MKVINQTKQTTLAEKIIIPKTRLSQSLGLLKYKTPTAMFLRTHFGVHTFGMRYPIDILILNKQNSVVALKVDLKPNRIFIWNFKYETILELPPGTIRRTNTTLQDKLEFH